jgi:hypothetical protein
MFWVSLASILLLFLMRKPARRPAGAPAAAHAAMD